MHSFAFFALAACKEAQGVDSALPATLPTETSTVVCEHEVPAPGNDSSPIDWTSDDSNLTPEDAWQVGTVSDGFSPAYVQTILPDDENNAYFVFKSDAKFDMQIRVQNSQNDFKHMHLFEAPDRCLGEQVEPVSEDIGSTYIESVFPVKKDGIYVVEIRVPGGGFF